jgi:alpha-D-ribose 1-methylphosphonate 5-phosphate C-P lyase
MIENKKFRQSYNYAFIDESTKKEIRRGILKAVAIPGHQIPYSSPEMPIARGWGTGGLHVTLSLMGKTDTLKVIDQGSDASVNACNIRDFVKMTTHCTTTFETTEASIIQSRHRIPEERLSDKQILVLQVPGPEPLRRVERYEFKTRQMHAEMDYAKMWLTLYEGYIKFKFLPRGPVMVNHRYIMAPSPIPRWDIPNLNMSDCLYLFGAGREKRLYAVPPHTIVEPLEFEDVKFDIENFSTYECAKTGHNLAYLDELYEDDLTRKFYINDSNFLDKVAGNKPVNQHQNKYLEQHKTKTHEFLNTKKN